jgi:hypothetical protein
MTNVALKLAFINSNNRNVGIKKKKNENNEKFSARAVLNERCIYTYDCSLRFSPLNLFC